MTQEGSVTWSKNSPLDESPLLVSSYNGVVSSSVLTSQAKLRVCRAVADVYSANACISLNVGGTAFTVSHHTLCSVPESMLALLTSEWLSIERDAAGVIFLDRPPQLFADVLVYLRLVADLRTTTVPSNDRDDSQSSNHNGINTSRSSSMSSIGGGMICSSNAPPNDVQCREEVRAAMALEQRAALQLMQTSWRHMTPAQLRSLAAEADYYNLKVLESHVLRYVERRWITYASFVSSGASLSELDGSRHAILCMDCDVQSGICVVGRATGVLDVYGLPALPHVATLRGHTMCVTAVKVTPTHMYSCSRDGFIGVWRMGLWSSPALTTHRAHDGFVHAMRLLSSALLASGGEDRTLRVWRITPNHLLSPQAVVELPGAVRCLTYWDHTRLLFAACHERIAIFEVREEEVRRVGFCGLVAAHRAPIRDLALDGHAELLASGCWDGLVYLWDLRGVVLRPEADVALCISPLYAVAQCESWISQLSFVGGLLAALCGSVLHVFDFGDSPHVVRCLKLGEGTKRVFAAFEEINCLLVGGFDGTLRVLHSRTCAESRIEKVCQWPEKE